MALGTGWVVTDSKSAPRVFPTASAARQAALSAAYEAVRNGTQVLGYFWERGQPLKIFDSSELRAPLGG